MAIINSGFELPDASGTPGEALGWTWTSVSNAEDWGDFNAALVAYLTDTERFAAGWALSWDVSYADAAARLAAGPFVAADEGLVARQESDGTLWALQQASPIIWYAIVDGIEDWAADLRTPLRTAVAFNGGSLYDSTIETFLLWDGPPWRLDALPPTAQDALGVGWRGATETALLDGQAVSVTVRHPLAVERFAEGWNLSPLAPVGAAAGAAWLRGAALTFPVVLPPNQNRLWAWVHGVNGLVEMTITPGSYADATTLGAALQNAWVAALGGVATVLEWRAWDDGVETGIELRWDGLRGAERVALGAPTHRASRDARARLGLTGRGPNGCTGYALLHYSELGATGDYWAALDPWACVDLRTVDSLDGSYFVLPGGGVAATFGTVGSGATPVRMERFELTPWFGAGATWVTDLLAPARATGTFDVPVGADATIELFTSAEWPDLAA